MLNEETLAAPRLLSGLHAVAAAYDGFILDLWGVLHDGATPYPGAVDCLKHLAAAGKRVVLLSNAPRRVAEVVKRLTEIGFAPDLYHGVMSSGEDAWRHLKRREDPFHAALGRRCYHLGPERDAGMLTGLDIEPAATPAEADFILNTGPWGWHERVEDYEERLRDAAARGLPMICANPDLVVHHAGRLEICAGTLARRYEELGGAVRWHGKPFASIYAPCFAMLEVADRRRILAVGDSLRTDIAGANAVGIDSVLIAGGIHGEELGHRPGDALDPEQIAAFLAAAANRPMAVMGQLFW